MLNAIFQLIVILNVYYKKNMFSIPLIISLIANVLLLGGFIVALYFAVNPLQNEPSIGSGIRYGDRIRIRTTNPSNIMTINSAPTEVASLVAKSIESINHTTFVIRPLDNNLNNTDPVKMSDTFLLQLDTGDENGTFYLRSAYETVTFSDDPTVTQWSAKLPSSYSGTSQSAENASFRFNASTCTGTLTSSNIAEWLATCDITDSTLQYNKNYVLSKVYNSATLYQSTLGGIRNFGTDQDDISVDTVYWQFVKST